MIPPTDWKLQYFTYEFLYNKFFSIFSIPEEMLAGLILTGRIQGRPSATCWWHGRSPISMDVQISKRTGIAVEPTGVSHGNVEMYLTVINLFIVVLQAWTFITFIKFYYWRITWTYFDFWYFQVYLFVKEHQSITCLNPNYFLRWYIRI